MSCGYWAVAAMTERSDPYLDALEQLDMMRDRAFKAEAKVQRVRKVLARYVTVPLSEMSQTDALGAIGEVIDDLDGDSDE